MALASGTGPKNGKSTPDRRFQLRQELPGHRRADGAQV